MSISLMDYLILLWRIKIKFLQAYFEKKNVQTSKGEIVDERILSSLN